MRKPRIGKTVTYTPTPKQKEAMITRIGGNVREENAAIITYVHENGNVNLQVFHDAFGTDFVQNIEQGKGPGQWEWPEDYDE